MVLLDGVPILGSGHREKATELWQATTAATHASSSINHSAHTCCGSGAKPRLGCLFPPARASARDSTVAALPPERARLLFGRDGIQRGCEGQAQVVFGWRPGTAQSAEGSS